ncbi:MAG TPA: type I DNA topoisomerase [Nitrospirae bacterium]|nr:type I DNA topoisomerase [Nitrospirota bacterium]HDO22169.1 type I DNA topoisomerase [Nitrospirota bacterium]HDZ87935.1 type I DNA topoisomerase [Nitrospirota bacterium]
MRSNVLKSLVIVESPAKAKTINKILGKDFSVKASVGHIRDLPSKEFAVDVENDFTPKYVVIPGKEKVIRELRKAAKNADNIFLAPDPDREGEAIAWHIASEIRKGAKGDKEGVRLFRVTFNEITARAVREAIKNPKQIDGNKVDAQQARRILDRIVGYKLSPLLWKKVRRGLSAGRVQSVAVKLIVDRERAIRAFKSEEYWSIEMLLEGSVPPRFTARLMRYENETVINRDASKTKDGAGGRKFLITSEKHAKAVVKKLKGLKYSLVKIERKKKRRSPAPPFITSTLQQEASGKLRFTARKTMMVAQKLYEGIEIGAEGSVGLITYMRTDSTRTAPEAVKWARDYITDRFGRDYVPKTPPRYKSKSTAQDAHEAIRPTYPDKSPENISKYLTKEQLALYSLIWKRFIASQTAPAQIEQTTFIVQPERHPDIELRATGSIIKFKGFLIIYPEPADTGRSTGDVSGNACTAPGEEAILPDLKEGEPLNPGDITPQQHFTQPPPRYSEATLVKTLEEKGIGRPSTYAAIISTVQGRKYVEKQDGRFAPTELGEVVNDLLVDKFPELVNEKFTAQMEKELDSIEEGKKKWIKVVRKFYGPFNKELNEATKTLGRVKPEDKPTDIVCNECGMPMVIRWGRHGRFLACTGYPKCKNTRPMEGEEKREIPVIQSDEKCDKCGSPMVIKTSRFGRFLACSGYPECKGTRPISTGIKCPEDGGEIVERSTRRGKIFFSCSNYPKCKFATWYRPVAKQCPQCDGKFLVDKKTKAGHFFMCLNKDCGYKEEIMEE